MRSGFSRRGRVPNGEGSAAAVKPMMSSARGAGQRSGEPFGSCGFGGQSVRKPSGRRA